MSFKICAIGCGNMASWGHGPSFKRYAQLHDDVTLAACCDINEKSARIYCEKFAFERYYTDIDTMLNAEKPDAVSLVVPVQLTAPLAVKILGLHYPLIMEKPPGLTREETLSIIEAARAAGVPNRVSFNRRYAPFVQKLKQLLQQNHNPLKIDSIQYNFSRIGRTDADFSTTAIHGIDTVRYITGSDYSHVRFRYVDHPELGPTTSSIFMDCLLKSGAVAQLSFTPVAGVVYERATVNLEGHTYTMNIPILGSYDGKGSLLHISGNKVVEEIQGEDLSVSAEEYIISGFYDENAGFFDAVKSGAVPSGDVAEALQSVEIADCIRRRAAEYCYI